MEKSISELCLGRIIFKGKINRTYRFIRTLPSMKVKRKIYIYFDDLDETVQKELLDLFGSVARGMSFVFDDEMDDGD